MGAAALVVAAAIASTIFWLRLPSRLPTDADYRAANALIASRAQPGDVIVLAPAWAERGRAFLDAAPVFAGADLAKDEYPGTNRQWLVALADAPRFDPEAARAALRSRGPALGAVERIGALLVELYEIPGPAQLHALTEHVADAVVSLDGASSEPCRLRRDGVHQCPRGEWNHVRAGWFEVEERPMRGIWAHPVDGAALRLEWPDVPLGRAVRGRAAFAGQSGKSGAEVELALEIDGHVVDKRTFRPRTSPQPFEFTFTGVPERGRLALLVTTPNAGMRHFVVDAWTAP